MTDVVTVTVWVIRIYMHKSLSLLYCYYTVIYYKFDDALHTTQKVNTPSDMKGFPHKHIHVSALLEQKLLNQM